MGLNNQKLQYNLIKYYYIEKQYTIKQISSVIGLNKSKVSGILKELNIEVVPDVTLKSRLELGFHLHHRALLSFMMSAKIAKVNTASLRKYFNKKKVLIRPSLYERLTHTQQNRFLQMWRDDRIYQQKHNFIIPDKYKQSICNRIGDSIIMHYEQGVSIQEMTSKGLIPLGRKTVTEFMKTNGIRIKQGEEYARLYTVNENYFKKIDTEGKAYWLGFIMGDGCIFGDDDRSNWGLRIGLQMKDRSQLVNFMKSINATNPIYSYLVDGKYPTCAISIQNTALAKSLEALGITRNKSLTAQLPSDIPPHLMNHFIRGLFDADGSIPKTKGVVMGVSICGTPELMSQVMNIMHISTKYLYIRKDLKNFGELRCHKVDEAIRILKYIYSDATIYMDRKYKRYKELCKRKTLTGEGVETIETTVKNRKGVE